MADKCFGCTGKFKFREKPAECPNCRRLFCSKCLDRKKVKESGKTCVYCSEKQKLANESEESSIIENFQERYYKHKKQGPPIVTRLQFDPQLANIAAAHASSKQDTSGHDIDRELEERFKRLREDHIAPAPSVAELEEQFNKFQGKERTAEDNQMGGAKEVGGDKTQFEQAQDLMQQMKEEVELEERVAGKDEDEIDRDNNSIKIEESNEVTDPEKLLNDLKDFTAKEEKGAINDIESSDIQSLLHIAANQSTDTTIVYPKFVDEATPTKPKSDKVSDDELGVLMRQAIIENKQEEKERDENERFMKYAAKKVSNLIDSDSSEEEVKSKPKGQRSTKGELGLDFNWDHYGAGNNWIVDDEGFDEQVHSLIQQMTDEAKLENQLESQGIILSNESTDGATTLQSYSAIGHEEQLPWCCMCNSDANIKCYDCDGDLYCVPCFSQAHENFGLFDHRYGPYEPSTSNNKYI